MACFFSSRCALVLFLGLETILSVSTAHAYISTRSAPVHLNAPYVNKTNEEKIFFQGQDNGLYSIFSDDPELFEATCDKNNDLTTSKATLLGTTGEIFSPPCVASNDWIYFQGANNELYKIKIDGTGLKDLNVQTFSTPAVCMHNRNGKDTTAYIYYQGTNSELYELCDDNSSPPTDFGVQILSAPYIGVYVSGWPYIYYQGGGNELCRSTPSFYNKALISNDLKNQTLSTPCFLVTYMGLIRSVYFRGTDNNLYYVSDDPGAAVSLHCHIYDSPIISSADSSHIYFQSDNNTLVQIKNDGSNAVTLHRRMKSTPCVSSSGDNIYFQSVDDRLIGIVLPKTQ
jgi:hypothetical protein